MNDQQGATRPCQISFRQVAVPRGERGCARPTGARTHVGRAQAINTLVGRALQLERKGVRGLLDVQGDLVVGENPLCAADEVTGEGRAARGNRMEDVPEAAFRERSGVGGKARNGHHAPATRLGKGPAGRRARAVGQLPSSRVKVVGSCPTGRGGREAPGGVDVDRLSHREARAGRLRLQFERRCRGSPRRDRQRRNNRRQQAGRNCGAQCSMGTSASMRSDRPHDHNIDMRRPFL